MAPINIGVHVSLSDLVSLVWRTWRERVVREVGGGIGMGKTCKLKDVSFQCMKKKKEIRKHKKKKRICGSYLQWNITDS